MRQLIAIALLAPLLISCGGSDASFDSIKDLAEAANCNGLKVDEADDRTMFATESGNCVFLGTEPRLNWFKGGGDGLDSFKKVAEEMGGSYILYGDNWAIECEDKESCDALQGNVGGEVS